MRSVILQEFVTLDGLAAGPNASVDFIPGATEGDHSFGDRQLRFMDSIDLILLGRVTYEMFAAYWPNVTSGDDKPFADKINVIPKIVFSSTLEAAPWGGWNKAIINRGNAADEVVQLKRESGKDIVIWGSISLTQTLMKAALVDQLQLIVCPIVLGHGTRLFRDQGNSFNLRGTESFDRGAVLLTYEGAARTT